jgi:hypothetical protein
MSTARQSELNISILKQMTSQSNIQQSKLAPGEANLFVPVNHPFNAALAKAPPSLSPGALQARRTKNGGKAEAG